MSGRIYMARHGETPLNAAGLLRGRLDPPLTTKGQMQAEALADALQGENIRLIVASPLQRAVATAGALAERVGLPVEIDERFNDRDYGVWSGISRDEVEARWGSVDNAPGVEPAGVVLERVLEGFRETTVKLRDGVGLIVSHDAINRPLLVALEASLAGRVIPQETGCYNVLRSTDDTWNVVSVNNVPPQPEQ
ncbi:MAG TPA: histidine phosphatase family protein [Acidimicrobiales bacterium]